MVIGVPKEVKDHETRVGLVPSAAAALVEAGHTVLVETKAGEGSTLLDDDYERVGARIVPEASDVWAEAELVVKVKEPQPSEYQYFRPGLTLSLTSILRRCRSSPTNCSAPASTAIAYETIVERDGSLPLLTPMSEVAGTHVGAGGRAVSGAARMAAAAFCWAAFRAWLRPMSRF